MKCFLDDANNQIIKASTEYISLDTHNANLYVDRGLAYAGIGDYVKAAEDLKTALKIGPNTWRTIELQKIIHKSIKEE
jgi:Tfp pilus assembly protein PilF